MGGETLWKDIIEDRYVKGSQWNLSGMISSCYSFEDLLLHALLDLYS